MHEKSIEEKAAEAEHLLQAELPGATCVPQEWDERVDCWVKLADGSLIGEKIPIAELSERRVIATRRRLKKRIAGSANSLINEIRGPVRLAAPTAVGTHNPVDDNNYPRDE